MGPQGSGKTSLLFRYLFNQFTENYLETIEDIHVK